MKKVLFALLPLIALLSCRPKTQQHINNKFAPVSSEANQKLKNLKKIYQGVWIKADYFKKIKEKQSVLAAVDLVKGITGMKIDSALASGDSVKVSVGWDNHNPGEVTLKVKQGKYPQSLPFGDDYLAYTIQNKDTTLILYQIYNSVFYKTLYNKLTGIAPEENVSYAINVAINKALIAGTYTFADGKKPNRQVQFMADGKVTGLEKFNKYVIENDLEFKPLNNLDLITFDVFTNRQQVFSYLFKDNVLELYAAKPNSDAKLMVLGKLKYRLVKIN